MKSGKRHTTERVEVSNKVIRTLGEIETKEYMGILDADTIKQQETKEKLRKRYLRKARKLLETKLYSENLVKGINNCPAHACKILGMVLEMDQRTTKLMTIKKELQLRDEFDRRYVSRKEDDLQTLKTAWTHRYNDSKTT